MDREFDFKGELFVPDIELFVVSHRKLVSSLYKDRNIIYVSHRAHEFKEKEDYIDSVGDNISSLNYTYCELTALYWIYKNVKCDFVGIEHYRRIFKTPFNTFVSKKALLKDLEHHDIILPIRYATPIKVKTQMINNHGTHSYILLEEAISKLYPDYLDSFYKSMNSHHANYFNMMVTRKEIFDQYCEFLFNILDFIFKKAKDIPEVDINRYLGFLGERLINTFVDRNNYDVIERLVLPDNKYNIRTVRKYYPQIEETVK